MEFIEGNSGNYHFITQIQILGSLNIGKTNLIERIKRYHNYSKYKTSQANIKRTIAYDFETFTVKINNKIIKVLFWDSVGYEDGRTLFCGWIKGNCRAYLISYDAFNRNSFNNAIKTYEELKIYMNKNPICILVRNKYDLEINKESKINEFVSDEEALEFADKNNIKFAHVSSIDKYGNGIKELLTLVLNQILMNEEIKKNK